MSLLIGGIGISGGDGGGGGGGGGTPGGSPTQFQYNNSGAFGGTDGIDYIAASKGLAFSGNLVGGSVFLTPFIDDALDGEPSLRLHSDILTDGIQDVSLVVMSKFVDDDNWVGLVIDGSDASNDMVLSAIGSETTDGRVLSIGVQLGDLILAHGSLPGGSNENQIWRSVFVSPGNVHSLSYTANLLKVNAAIGKGVEFNFGTAGSWLDLTSDDKFSFNPAGVESLILTDTLTRSLVDLQATGYKSSTGAAGVTAAGVVGATATFEIENGLIVGVS